MKARCLSVLFGISCIAVSTQGQEWTRNFRAGMQLGLNIKADFKTSGTLPLSTKNPGVSGQQGDHEFDDGYIRVDGTGNALERTSYWGAQNPSQSDGSTLTFHHADSFQSATSVNKTSDDAPYIGFELAYGGTIRRWNHSRLGWEFGFGFLPIDIKNKTTLSGTLTVTPWSTGDTGITLPNLPYDGSPSGIGATIPGDPTAGAPVTAPGTLSGTRSLDLTLYSFRLGPTYYWHFAPKWGLSASAGPALGIVNGDYVFNEIGTQVGGVTTQVSGKFSNSDFIFGGYVNALVLFRLEDKGDLFAGVQFMSLTTSQFSRGGRSATLDPTAGFYFTTGINWPF
jgi:hypothetical protein